jgi:hydroxyacid-oxoacid transhydrogenase
MKRTREAAMTSTFPGGSETVNALRLLAGSFRQAVRDGDDLEARGRMALAATMAGLGFGNAGVHIPHANAYPIAGRVKDFRPDGYPKDEPIVPHGMAVSLTAPEAFWFTFPASPERHPRAAELLAPGLDRPGDDAEQLPAALVLADKGFEAQATGWLAPWRIG